MRSAICWLLSAALAGLAPAGTTDPELQRGIRQVNNGELDAAVVTLDAVIVKLSAAAATRTGDLAQAHLYKGVALVGLQQEEPAKASFRDALRHAPALRIQKGEFPDRVVRVFEAARKGKTDSVMKRPSGAPRKAGIGTGAVLAIVGGVLAAGGAAAAVSGGNGGSSGDSQSGNRPPSNVAVTTDLDGVAIAHVTVVGFTAQASDADGDAITYTWAFGDGDAGTGSSVSHIFTADRTFTVTVTAADVRGGSATGQVSVTARTLDGTWTDNTPYPPCSRFEACFPSTARQTIPSRLTLTQNRDQVTGTTIDGCHLRYTGTLTSPRNVRLFRMYEPPGLLPSTCGGNGGVTTTGNQITVGEVVLTR
jgi:hypothetical protein